MESDHKQKQLEKLSSHISGCTKCDRNIQVVHAPVMFRGQYSRIIVIGIEPGNTEIGSGKAFSGAGGKRLMEWLKEGGVGSNGEEIYNKVYFTSICKCKIDEKGRFWRAATNCFPYLQEQIALLQPKLCITLGKDPVRFLFSANVQMEELVGEIFIESDFHQTLFPVLPQFCKIIPLPHPSPLSRWTNLPSNKRLLKTALNILYNELSNENISA